MPKVTQQDRNVALPSNPATFSFGEFSEDIQADALHRQTWF